MADGWPYPKSKKGAGLGLERIVDTREDCEALAPVTDINITDYKGFGDAAKAQPADGMEMAERVIVEGVEHPAYVDERGQFQDAMGREDIRLEHAGAQLEVGRKKVVVDKASATEAP